MSDLEANLTPLEGRFTDGVVLTGVRLPSEVVNGELLPVELHWQDLSTSHKLFIHLLDESGVLVAQRDTVPAPTPDRYALSIACGLTFGFLHYHRRSLRS